MYSVVGLQLTNTAAQKKIKWFRRKLKVSQSWLVWLSELPPHCCCWPWWPVCAARGAPSTRKKHPPNIEGPCTDSTRAVTTARSQTCTVSATMWAGQPRPCPSPHIQPQPQLHATTLSLTPPQLPGGLSEGGDGAEVRNPGQTAKGAAPTIPHPAQELIPPHPTGYARPTQWGVDEGGDEWELLPSGRKDGALPLTRGGGALQINKVLNNSFKQNVKQCPETQSFENLDKLITNSDRMGSKLQIILRWMKQIDKLGWMKQIDKLGWNAKITWDKYNKIII